MIKKIICLISSLMFITTTATTALADQKSTFINKEIVYVDGYMDESYKTSGTITVDQIVKQNGTSDTTATINLLYDDTYIYIFGSVLDKTRVSSPPEHEWTSDSVEIQLDLDCYDADQVVGSGYTGLFRIVRYTGTVAIDEKSTSPAFIAVKDAIQCRVVDTGENGYNFEVAIPHANSFRTAKLGVSCIVNDATDAVKNLAAMIFMNSTHTGAYPSTKSFYRFDLNSFINARSADAPTYVSSAVAQSSGTVSSDISSEELTDKETSSLIQSNHESDLPKDAEQNSVNPIIICVAVIAAALVIIIVSLIIKSNKRKKTKNDK